MAAALVARFAALDFIGTLYLMRLSGFAAMTAVVAYALAITPCLRWTFLCIAMLPAALYGRAVISADGGAFAYSLVVVAFFLRGAAGVRAGGPAQHALWMTLCVLSKPPHLAFIVLEAMRRPLTELSRNWCALALIVLPAVGGTVGWHVVTSGDAAGWRMSELTGMPLEQFNPAWKLRFMLAHPLHFPSLLGVTLQDPGELWRQLIGVLGLFDTVLQPWVYPVLSIIFLAVCFVPLTLERGTAAGSPSPPGLRP